MDDYDFCKQTLNANLKNPDANISDLNQLTIDLTTRNATDTRAFTQSVLKNSTSDPEGVKVLSECEKDYGLVVEFFEEAFKSYKQGDYTRMLWEAGFNSAAPGPVNPYFFLIERNKPLKTLVDMAIVIARTFVVSFGYLPIQSSVFLFDRTLHINRIKLLIRFP